MKVGSRPRLCKNALSAPVVNAARLSGPICQVEVRVVVVRLSYGQKLVTA